MSANIAMRSFSQKRSTLYIREFDETHKKNYWIELTEWTEYERLILLLQQKLLKMYESKHNEALERNDNTQKTHVGTRSPPKDDRYFENIKKILLTNQQSELTSKYFKQSLYEELKADIEIKYEVVF